MVRRLAPVAILLLSFTQLAHSQALSTPVTVEPLTQAAINYNSVIAYQWEPVAEATSYDFLIYDRSQGAITFRTSVAASLCSSFVCDYTPTNAPQLPIAVNHVWRVAAKNTNATSKYTYTLFDIIESGDTPTIPSTPVPIFPARDSQIESPGPLSYQWVPSADAESYDFLIYDRLQGAVTFRTSIAASLCSTSVCDYTPTNAPQLSISDNHLWRVAAINTAGKSEYTYTLFDIVEPVNDKVTTIPNTPEPSFPAYGSEVESPGPLSYQWVPSTEAETYDFLVFDRLQGEITYRTSVAASLCSLTVCDYTPTDAPQLPIAGNHLWRVAAQNTAGKSDYTYTLFDIIEPVDDTVTTIPNTPEPIFPTLGAEVTSPGPLSYQWVPSAGVQSYEFLIFDRSQGAISFRTSVAASLCSTTVCDYTPTDAPQLPIANNHVWRVAAKNSYGTSNYTYSYFDVVSASQLLDDYDLVFFDEFSGATLDSSKWQTGLLWGPYLQINNEEQLYVDTLGINSGALTNPLELTGETLIIRATPTSSEVTPPERPAQDDPVWNNFSEYQYNGVTSNGPGYDPDDVNYLSGIITSYDAFKMTHGYVEARVKLPSGAGLWPAFWLLNSHYVEDSPEIDIMEFLGQNVDEVYHTYHYFDVEDNWAKISSPTYVTEHSDWTQDFHTFGVAWSPNALVWYIDGNEVRRITDQDFEISTQSMYLIANLAVGGNWPGSPDESTIFPAEYEIDYIRAYKKKRSEPVNLDDEFQLMFSDEFNNSTLDPIKWKTSFLWGPYFPINNEEQYYVDSMDTDSDKSYSPFSFSSEGNTSFLSITARTANDSGNDLPPAQLPDSNDPIWTQHPEFQQGPYEQPPFTSGIITSYDSFKFVNGYAEIRARVPEGDGLWPAFWLLNAYYVGTQPEIDIMEILGENPNKVHHSFHRFDTDGQLISDQFTTTESSTQNDFADNFHRYGVHWQPGKITWYVDGNLVHTYEDPDATANDAYQLMYVIANLAVGGNFNTQPVDSSKLPASFDIDYIRVYQELDTP